MKCLIGVSAAIALLVAVGISTAAGQEATHEGVCQPRDYAIKFVKDYELVEKAVKGNKKLYVLADGQWLVLEWHPDGQVCLTDSGQDNAPATP